MNRSDELINAIKPFVDHIWEAIFAYVNSGLATAISSASDKGILKSLKTMRLERYPKRTSQINLYSEIGSTILDILLPESPSDDHPMVLAVDIVRSRQVNAITDKDNPGTNSGN